MGTRSIIKFIKNDKPVCAVYQQFDGYLSAVGAELAEFLASGRMVNGIPVGSGDRMFNGIGCLAAQYIAAVKKEAGGLYLYPVDCGDEECNYEVHADYGPGMQPLPVRVTYKGYEGKFDGSVSDFQAFIKEKTSAEAE